MVPSRVIGRDRIHSSAIALGDWFREHNMAVHGINILTEEAHARCTQLSIKKHRHSKRHGTGARQIR